MQNLNTQIANLVSALKTPQPQNANTLLVTEPSPFNVPVFEQSQTAIALTDAELAISEPTIERIQVGDKMSEYILIVGMVYRAENRTRQLPDWLKMQGDDEKFFADFATGLATAQPEVLQKAETQFGAITRAQFDTLYASWQTLRGEEQLKKDAQVKVRNGIDLRATLAKALRYYGYTEGEIDTVQNQV